MNSGSKSTPPPTAGPATTTPRSGTRGPSQVGAGVLAQPRAGQSVAKEVHDAGDSFCVGSKTGYPSGVPTKLVAPADKNTAVASSEEPSAQFTCPNCGWCAARRFFEAGDPP